MENKTSFKSIMLTYGLYLGIAGIIAQMINYSFGNKYDPSLIMKIIPYLLVIGFVFLGLKLDKNPDMSEEEMEMGIMIFKKMMNPAVMLPTIVLMRLILGFFVSLIAGLIMKKEETQF